MLLLNLSVVSFAQVHVRGYYRKDGTYVRPHVRTRPNHTVTDNYSYPGNYNPNTGRITGGSVRVAKPAVPTTRKNYSSYAPSLSVDQTELSVDVDANTPVSVNPVYIAKQSSQLYAETEPNAALKAEPSYLAVSRYAIPKGSLVKVTKYDEYYYLVEVDGRSGYVCSCQIKKTFTKLN